MFKLEDHHLEAAQKIAQNHRRKKSCDNCFDRGWIGVTEQNMLVLCTRCVDMEAALEDWKAYVSEHEDLKEHFSELFEEKEVEPETEDHSKPALHDHKKSSPHAKTTFVPGQKRTGRAKKI
jgi:hypothetical protein